jgi:hypothetical protein
MKQFRCVNCKSLLIKIIKLSDECWWYECPNCKCQASHWGPNWEERFDLTGVTIYKEKG